MDDALIERAKEEWSSGKPLEAGRLIYERLLPSKRPAWAGAALALARPHFPQLQPVEAVLELTQCPLRWREGHEAFQAVRELTLATVREAQPASPDPLYYAFLVLAENTPKVTYNALGGPAPFDANCGWWVVSNLYDVVKRLNDPELVRTAWQVISGPSAGVDS